MELVNYCFDTRYAGLYPREAFHTLMVFLSSEQLNLIWSGSLVSWIPDSQCWILDSKAQDSGFHKHKIRGFRNSDSLTCGDISSIRIRNLNAKEITIGILIIMMVLLSFCLSYAGVCCSCLQRLTFRDTLPIFLLLRITHEFKYVETSNSVAGEGQDEKGVRKRTRKWKISF